MPTVALQTALQIFICILIGMANMIAWEQAGGWQPDLSWLPYGPLLPYASFQMVTYVFLMSKLKRTTTVALRTSSNRVWPDNNP